MSKTLVPGVYFGHVELNQPILETFTENCLGDDFQFDYQNQTVTHLRTNNVRNINKWTDTGISFDHFKL